MPGVKTAALPLAVLIGVLASQSGCGRPPSRAKDISFKGSWTLSEENGITNKKSEATVDVVAENGRFTTVKKYELHDPDSVSVNEEKTSFDGDFVTIEKNSREPARIKATEATLKELRFWADDDWLWQLTKKGPDERIAGRETDYYEGKSKRLDGEVSIRVWADKETGLILRAITTITSLQVDSMVMRTTQECRRIDIAP
jgi:hypothetical protein